MQGKKHYYITISKAPRHPEYNLKNYLIMQTGAEL